MLALFGNTREKTFNLGMIAAPFCLLLADYNLTMLLTRNVFYVSRFRGNRRFGEKKIVIASGCSLEFRREEQVG